MGLIWLVVEAESRPSVVVISTGFRWRQMWLLVLDFPKEIASYIGTERGGEKGGISWDLGGLGGYKLQDQLA